MLNTSLIEFIYVENILPKDFCDSVLLESERLEYESHAYTSYEGENRNSEKELEVAWPESDIVNQIEGYIAESIRRYLSRLSFNHFPKMNAFSKVRFNKYNKESRMDMHCDHIHTLFDGEERGVPVLSVVGLLNDNFTGGEFVMWDRCIELNKGDIVLFPSNFMYPHAVLPINSGMRHSFVSWAW